MKAEGTGKQVKPATQKAKEGAAGGVLHQDITKKYKNSNNAVSEYYGGVRLGLQGSAGLTKEEGGGWVGGGRGKRPRIDPDEARGVVAGLSELPLDEPVSERLLAAGVSGNLRAPTGLLDAGEI